ncbi:MAG TPA: hypothetical protein VK794_10515 [Steroidobacteraceae bacterium]|nr:hypothetical protein [Steroidobacteraceae bacterium]
MKSILSERVVGPIPDVVKFRIVQLLMEFVDRSYRLRSSYRAARACESKGNDREER